jgi:hypothetical protein
VRGSGRSWQPRERHNFVIIHDQGPWREAGDRSVKWIDGIEQD